jgi:MYXO-CTERM domain-containing protein
MGLIFALLQVTVTVDAAQDVHSISPLIYGMNFPDAAQLADGKIPLARWGGNGTSRYNYQLDMNNTGNDYYFENLPGCWGMAANYCNPPTSDPMNNSGANAFVSQMMTAGTVQLITMPTIGYVAKRTVYNHPFDCGCPVSALGAQDSVDPYDTNCGNCVHNGTRLTPPAATQTSTAVGPDWDGGWAMYLVNRFGASNGQRIYALDNEPALWSSTHYDIRPQRLSYDELWQRMRDHAVAILTADPTAQIAGPAEWGWPNYFCSDADVVSNGCSAGSPDRAAHGGEELVAWLLDQAKAYEQAHAGQRILHYLDLHYYPQGGNPPDIVRSLYDPNYTDPSWINDKIKLIPRMRDWVAQHYPGTKILVSEYDFYHHNEAIGAVTYAEVLGLFGREGLDAATAWSPPGASEAAFGAFKLYRNFDGQGGHFEDNNARATVSGGSGVAAFAATGLTQMTVVLVNETGAAQSVTVALQNFESRSMASVYTGNSPTITKQTDVAISGNQLMVSVPATSFAMVVVPRLHDIDAGVDAPSGTGGSGGGAGGSGGGNGAGSTESGCGCVIGGRAETSGMFVWIAVLAAFFLGRFQRRRQLD